MTTVKCGEPTRSFRGYLYGFTYPLNTRNTTRQDISPSVLKLAITFYASSCGAKHCRASLGRGRCLESHPLWLAELRHHSRLTGWWMANSAEEVAKKTFFKSSPCSLSRCHSFFLDVFTTLVWWSWSCAWHESSLLDPRPWRVAGNIGGAEGTSLEV